MKKKLLKLLLPPLVHLIIRLLWMTCRVTVMNEQSHIKQLRLKQQPVLFCYWHQHHIFGAYFMRQLAAEGMKIGFLISPSADGDMSAKLAKAWGFEVIRGSSHRTGAKAMRDLYNVVTKDGISPVNTSDGPTGPLHEFKPGAIMLAQLSGAPIVLFSYAASRYWQLRSWDEFIIPKPFSRIAMITSAIYQVDKKLAPDQLQQWQEKMQQQLQTMQQQVTEAVNI